MGIELGLIMVRITVVWREMKGFTGSPRTYSNYGEICVIEIWIIGILILIN